MIDFFIFSCHSQQPDTHQPTLLLHVKNVHLKLFSSFSSDKNIAAENDDEDNLGETVLRCEQVICT